MGCASHEGLLRYSKKAVGSFNQELADSIRVLAERVEKGEISAIFMNIQDYNGNGGPSCMIDKSCVSREEAHFMIGHLNDFVMSSME